MNLNTPKRRSNDNQNQAKIYIYPDEKLLPEAVIERITRKIFNGQDGQTTKMMQVKPWSGAKTVYDDHDARYIWMHVSTATSLLIVFRINARALAQESGKKISRDIFHSGCQVVSSKRSR